MSAEQVSSLCEQLVKAVTVIMDPASTQRYRLEALKFCEEFKEKCPICVPCGLKLAEKTQTAIVRHFGLQILEHVVKFRWNSMPRLEKVYLKNNVMGLISNGTQNILEEESHIKDVLSRIVVEMIKREWPQHWPDMLKELDTLSKQGETQTELVMFILLRLAEDVVTFQTLPTQRRRDIQQTLTQNMEKIFSFLLTTLQQNVNKYRRMKTELAQEPKAQANCRVGIAALNTLAGYIDWVAMSHITADNCKLLEMLCLLLNEPELQVGAAECLLIAGSRKGKLEDRKPLMVLFGDVAMHYILSAAQTADGEGLVEKHYVFLKRLCQVLCALGSQLCALVGSDSDVDTPANLGKYLDSFLAFTTHPSQFLRSSTQITWGALFRHEILSREPLLLAMIPKYLRASMTNLVKVGFPSKTDSPSCEYSRFDFDSDEDFNAFFNSKTGEGLCSIFSPSFVQWDAMTFFSESVISQMFRTLDKEEIPVNDGIELLQLVLNFETKDPLILSCVLTNVSALFPFVTYRPEYLPQVLSKLFTAVTFEVIEESKPNFEMLYNHVKQLLSNELLLTQMEKCALMEALVLISNQFKDYQRQKVFLEELMSPVANLWLSEEMQRVLSDPEAFISYVGADNKITDPVLEDPSGLNRSRISFCVYTILGVVKRARWPTTLEEAKAGGFVIGCMPSGNPIYRNPCTEQVLKLLDNLLALIRTHNNLYMPEMVAKLGETFAKALDMLEVEKNAILGLPQPLLELYDSPVYKTILERMQGFFCTLYDNCFHILGNAGPSMQQDFYTVDGLASQFLNSAFVNLNNIPDYRLRPMLPVSTEEGSNPPIAISVSSGESCPALLIGMGAQETTPRPQRKGIKMEVVLLGLGLESAAPWTPSLWGAEEDTADDNPESQEMLEEQLVRLLTREVMDLITVCCVSKKGTAEHNSSTAADGDDDEMMSTDVTPPSSAELTELGKCLMKQEVLTGNLLPDAVTWFFTGVLKGLQTHGQHDGCMAALVHLAFQIYEALRPRYAELKAVMEQIPEIQKESLEQFDSKLLNPTLLKVADKRRKDNFKRLIAGCIGLSGAAGMWLQHILHSVCAALALFSPGLGEMVTEHSGHLVGALLAEGLLALCVQGSCREGKPLGEQFRKEVHIRNLPSLFKKVKPSLETDVLENNEDGEGLTALFEP
ncbi:Exportin-5 [Chelonia mydas]|uniref:Exportin-5 n=1 Tax=Chelonia mydas TaxID=8469 RepID=M7ANY4_CHEMY|nr:Exportin-5 [Chelonia mydas]